MVYFLDLFQVNCVFEALAESVQFLNVWHLSTSLPVLVLPFYSLHALLVLHESNFVIFSIRQKSKHLFQASLLREFDELVQDVVILCTLSWKLTTLSPSKQVCFLGYKLVYHSEAPVVCCEVKRSPQLDASSCIYIELPALRKLFIESNNAIDSFLLIPLDGRVQWRPAVIVPEIELCFVLHEYFSNCATLLRVFGVNIHDHMQASVSVLIYSVDRGTFLEQEPHDMSVVFYSGQVQRTSVNSTA